MSSPPACRTCRQPLLTLPHGRPRQFCGDACRMVAYRKRRKRAVYHRSDSVEWETPRSYYDELNAVYHFDLDVCATASNAKCSRYFTREQDGLRQTWTGRCWMNPPYGNDIGKWLAKAVESVESGSAEVVVCLVPSRTGTRWWHAYAVKADVEFLKGRLRFGGKDAAPFDSALLIFRNAEKRSEMQDGEPEVLKFSRTG